jgi:hypothetical protein
LLTYFERVTQIQVICAPHIVVPAGCITEEAESISDPCSDAALEQQAGLLKIHRYQRLIQEVAVRQFS